jgi:hypothetical protein
MKKRVKRTTKFVAGYVIHSGSWEIGPDDWVSMKWAETPDGHYIGSSRMAYRLCVTKGIKPQLAKKKHTVCTIGFSERLQEWWGWSDRAWCGFGIGSKVEEGDVVALSGRFPVGFEAKTLEHAKKMAIAFAEEVG